MAKPVSELADSLRSAQRMLFLAGASAFAAALLVSHLLGPFTLWLLSGSSISPLWDPFLIGVALAITGAPLAWLMARGFEMPPRTAGLAVGLLGTLALCLPTVLTKGLEALWDVAWSFPLRLTLAVVGGLVAERWALLGLPASVAASLRNAYAAAVDETKPRVVILGGGFAGLAAARALAKAPVRVTLVDAHNHHLFQPLLYQVATAALPPTSIASPLRRILRKQGNAEVLMARATGVDLDARVLKLEGGEVKYDRLIVATGATDSYFGHDDWAKFAPGLKSLDEALDIRNRMLRAFEAAERERDPAAQAALLTFVVVGGGPTGVELTGAMTEIARQTLDRDFRHIQPAEARVVLIESGARLLAQFDEHLSANALKSLKDLGAEVRLQSSVTGIDGGGVTLKAAEGEQRIASRTVLWAAGVRASPFGAHLGVALDKTGRVPVEPDLSVSGRPEIYVIGDLAAVTDGGKSVPALAPAAMQAGKRAAANVVRSFDNQPGQPFHYRDKGSLATIGRWKAVGQLGRFRMTGLFAWLVWVLVHTLYLIGFRNRYIVLSQWAFDYLFHDRGARLITGQPQAPNAPHELSAVPAPNEAR